MVCARVQDKMLERFILVCMAIETPIGVPQKQLLKLDAHRWN